MMNTTRNIVKHALTCAALCIWAQAALAQGGVFAPANGVETSAQVISDAGYDLPISEWRYGDGVSFDRLRGTVDLRSYRIDATSQTPDQIISPIRDAASAAGFAHKFNCAADTCGGFDFRTQVSMIDPPYMFVDLRNFVAFSAQSETGSAIFAVASRMGPVGYVQIAYVQASDDPTPPPPAAAIPSQSSVPKGGYVDQLRNMGSVILDDLEFESGSSNLGKGPFQSLNLLADFLRANSEARIVLVGHTDAVGSLATNIALSEKRANSVMSYLTRDLGVAASQLDAKGIGYLSPVATNDTPFGREENRRVVAVLVAPIN